MQRKIDYFIEGLDCSEEISLLKKVLSDREGIEELAFDVLHAKLTVTIDSERVENQTVLEWIASSGMRATNWERRDELKKKSSWKRHVHLITTALSLLLLLVAAFSPSRFAPPTVFLLHLLRGLFCFA